MMDSFEMTLNMVMRSAVKRHSLSARAGTLQCWVLMLQGQASCGRKAFVWQESFGKLCAAGKAVCNSNADAKTSSTSTLRRHYWAGACRSAHGVAAWLHLQQTLRAALMVAHGVPSVWHRAGMKNTRRRDLCSVAQGFCHAQVLLAFEVSSFCIKLAWICKPATVWLCPHALKCVCEVCVKQVAVSCATAALLAGHAHHAPLGTVDCDHPPTFEMIV
eukprot:359622-Chlamydomonas_euryale.AAC.2